MKKIFYSIFLCVLSFSIFAQTTPETQKEKLQPKDSQERMSKMKEKLKNLEEITLTGELQFEFSKEVEEKEGKKCKNWKNPTILKDEKLYKIQFPLKKLIKEGIEPGTTVTVVGKAIPSNWMNDNSVSVFVKTITVGDKTIEAPACCKKKGAKNCCPKEKPPKKS